MAMIDPGTLLAFLAAVFRASTSATLGKLANTCFPLAALIIGTLSNAAACVILSAQVPHHNTSPILHILAMVPDSELLYEREDVEVVWK